jgi:hypothetical protein
MKASSTIKSTNPRPINGRRDQGAIRITPTLTIRPTNAASMKTILAVGYRNVAKLLDEEVDKSLVSTLIMIEQAIRSSGFPLIDLGEGANRD